jgi:hypothetical protein
VTQLTRSAREADRLRNYARPWPHSNCPVPKREEMRAGRWRSTHGNSSRASVVDYLLVACIELARLELRSGMEAPAERLLSWAAEVLAGQATGGDTSAALLDPNDTRHRLRARLCEAQALLAAHQGDRPLARAQGALHRAHEGLGLH